MLSRPWAVRVGRWVVESYAGGRTMYSTWQEGFAETAVTRLSVVDSRYTLLQFDKISAGVIYPRDSEKVGEGEVTALHEAGWLCQNSLIEKQVRE